LSQTILTWTVLEDDLPATKDLWFLQSAQERTQNV
jgi:hypothetical protein